MKRKLSLALAAVVALIILLAFPILHVAVVLINFVVHMIVLGLQLVTSRTGNRSSVNKQALKHEPFISIHVPAHNEPPEVLRETLQALSRIAWQNYEVLVIDNNTSDETLWRPIEELCRQLGPRFRFLHVEGLRGAKAGALNWARPQMDPRAEFVFIVDADYVVDHGALRRAVSYFTDDHIALVQFPQDYRNIGTSNAGLALDFKHFFAGYMNVANRLGSVPSTGTLSLIRVSALNQIDGFNPTVVTEDADLGFRLNARGFRSVYVNEVIGRGLMPHDLESLKKQRWRWAFGNAQILKLNWRELLLSRQLSPRQKLGYLIHLTAWFNFNLIPSLTLILMAPLAWFGAMHPLQPYLVVASGFTLTSYMALRFGTIFYSLRREGHSLGEIASAFLTHLGLGWIFSSSWLKCLMDHRSPFVRTNKFLSMAVPSVLRTTLVELTLGVALLASCIILTACDYVVAPIAAFVSSGARFLIYWVWWQTRQTHRLTVKLQADEDRRWLAADSSSSGFQRCTG